MSLIADALKAAQKSRSQDREADRARRVLSDSGRTAVRLPGARKDTPRGVLVAGAVLATAVAGLVGVVLLMPRPGSETSAADQVQTAAAAVREPTAAQGEAAPSPDPGAADPQAGSDPVEAGTPVQAPEAGPDPVPEEPPAQAGSAGALAEVERPSGGLEGEVAPGLEAPSASFRLSVEPAPEADDLFRRGVSAHRRGAYAEAVTYYRQALSRAPGDEEIHNNLGTAYRSMGRLSDAETHFRRAIALAPEYAAAWSNLGVVLDARGLDQEAVAAYREALRHDPANKGAKVNLAQAYLGLGTLDQAESLLREVIAEDPAFAEAHYVLGRVLDDRGDSAGAIRHYEAFMASAGEFPGLAAAVRQRLAALRGGG